MPTFPADGTAAPWGNTLKTYIDTGSVARAGVTNSLAAGERIRISAADIAMYIEHASDLTAAAPDDLVDTVHQSTGDAFYVMHIGGKAPGYAGSVGGMAGFNVVVPAHRDDTAGSGRLGTTINDRTNQLGLAIEVQTAGSSTHGAQILSWSNQSALYIVTHSTVNARTDAGCGTTSGSPTVTDTHIVATDIGKSVRHANIPNGSFVGAVVPGVSFDLSSSATTNTPVNATATGSGLSVVVDYPTGQGKAVEIQDYGDSTSDTMTITRYTTPGAGKANALLRLIDQVGTTSKVFKINNSGGQTFSIQADGQMDWRPAGGSDDVTLKRSGTGLMTLNSSLILTPQGAQVTSGLTFAYPDNAANTFAAIVLNNQSTHNSVILKIQQAGSDVFSWGTAGIPKWANSANAQTTVGAAGAAAALPATPVKYLKVQDSSGTTYVVPVYNP